PRPWARRIPWVSPFCLSRTMIYWSVFWNWGASGRLTTTISGFWICRWRGLPLQSTSTGRGSRSTNFLNRLRNRPKSCGFIRRSCSRATRNLRNGQGCWRNNGIIISTETTKNDMTADELFDLEIRLLLEGIYQVYGYDFREYSEASLRRRMTQWLSGSGFATLSFAQSHLLRDRALFDTLLRGITINVSEMFRDPAFFKTIREQ